MKFTPVVENLKGKRVVLVDDSIVRGNTTFNLVKLLFEGGAKEVHVRVSSPPVRSPCFMGLDMSDTDHVSYFKNLIHGEIDGCV
jgi:amidophosphoribosyltransferase